MGILNIALTLLGAGAELVDRVMGRGQHEKAQLNANTMTLRQLIPIVAGMETRLQDVENDVQAQAELLYELAEANATLAWWVLALGVACLVLGGVAIAALVLAV